MLRSSALAVQAIVTTTTIEKGMGRGRHILRGCDDALDALAFHDILRRLIVTVVLMTGRSFPYGLGSTDAGLRARRIAAALALLAILLQAFAPVGQVWAAVAQQEDWVFPPACVAVADAPADRGGDPLVPAGKQALSEHCGFCFVAGTGGALVLPESPVVAAPIPLPLRIGPLASAPSARSHAFPPAYPRGPPSRA